MKSLFMSSGDLSNALIGLTFLSLLFLLSVVIVVGTKTVVIFFKNKLFPTPQPKKRKVIHKRKPIKSIEINPDEVDRIVVKKNG